MSSGEPWMNDGGIWDDAHVTKPRPREWAAPGTCTFARGLERQRPPQCEDAMARCETCGNDYDKAFQVTLNGASHTFDSFECAIQALAPTCPHCGTHVVGHGLEKDGTF